MRKIVIFLMILVLGLSFFFFPSGKILCDDSGNTNNTNSQNPQTTLMENVKAQEMIAELQKMAVIVTKNA